MNLIEQYALGSFVVIGFVNGVNFALEKQWPSFIRFFIAVLAGTAIGALGWFGLPGIEMGLALGIASSGVYKSLQVLRGE